MPPRRTNGLLERAERFGRLLENSCLIVVLAAMILLAAGQILLRNFFGSGIAWADEALRLMVLWLTMIGAVAASREHRHISIDVLARILRPQARLWAATLVQAFTAVVTALIAWHSWLFVADSFAYQDRLVGDLPAWALQAVLPAGFALISYRYVVALLATIGALRQGDRSP